MTDGDGEFLIRPARERDLDVITGFEIDIARVSFGAEAIEDPELHRKRVAAALGKPGEVTLVAVTEQDNAVPVPGTATSAPWPPRTSPAAPPPRNCS